MSAALATYLRALVTGTASTVWRVLRNSDCPCEYCRAHRQFIRDSATAYRAEVRGLPSEPHSPKAPATSETGWPA